MKSNTPKKSCHLKSVEDVPVTFVEAGFCSPKQAQPTINETKAKKAGAKISHHVISFLKSDYAFALKRMIVVLIFVYDAATDLNIAIKLFHGNHKYWFSLTISSLIAPFILLWGQAFRYLEKTTRQPLRTSIACYRHVQCSLGKICTYCYFFPPIGIFLVILYDISDIFKTVIVLPIVLLLRCILTPWVSKNKNVQDLIETQSSNDECEPNMHHWSVSTSSVNLANSENISLLDSDIYNINQNQLNKVHENYNCDNKHNVWSLISSIINQCSSLIVWISQYRVRFTGDEEGYQQLKSIASLLLESLR